MCGPAKGRSAHRDTTGVRAKPCAAIPPAMRCRLPDAAGGGAQDMTVVGGPRASALSQANCRYSPGAAPEFRALTRRANVHTAVEKGEPAVFNPGGQRFMRRGRRQGCALRQSQRIVGLGAVHRDRGRKGCREAELSARSCPDDAEGRCWWTAADKAWSAAAGGLSFPGISTRFAAQARGRQPRTSAAGLAEGWARGVRGGAGKRRPQALTRPARPRAPRFPPAPKYRRRAAPVGGRSTWGRDSIRFRNGRDAVSSPSRGPAEVRRRPCRVIRHRGSGGETAPHVGGMPDISCGATQGPSVQRPDGRQVPRRSTAPRGRSWVVRLPTETASASGRFPPHSTRASTGTSGGGAGWPHSPRAHYCPSTESPTGWAGPFHPRGSGRFLGESEMRAVEQQRGNRGSSDAADSSNSRGVDHWVRQGPSRSPPMGHRRPPRAAYVPRAGPDLHDRQGLGLWGR